MKIAVIVWGGFLQFVAFSTDVQNSGGWGDTGRLTAAICGTILIVAGLWRIK